MNSVVEQTQIQPNVKLRRRFPTQITIRQRRDYCSCGDRVSKGRVHCIVDERILCVVTDVIVACYPVG
ncbi:hypothetical protein, partial [Neisseria sp. P0015.S002]|uniref:hypothetical protein n=1 Tax=Neisseria sp. P0015.S002 TaxID=3436758 RepID=UPI003F7F43E5